MCECQGNPLARVNLALGLPYLLVNRALQGTEERRSLLGYELSYFALDMIARQFNDTIMLAIKNYVVGKDVRN